MRLAFYSVAYTGAGIVLFCLTLVKVKINYNIIPLRGYVFAESQPECCNFFR